MYCDILGKAPSKKGTASEEAYIYFARRGQRAEPRSYFRFTFRCMFVRPGITIALTGVAAFEADHFRHAEVLLPIRTGKQLCRCAVV